MDRVETYRLFQSLNYQRFQHLIEMAPARQALIFQLLPLFLHINAKLLPGYISDDVPAGLLDYRPSQDTINKAQQLNRSFSHRVRALRRYPLRGLYLINPHHHYSYSDKTEFELWVLCSDLVDIEQRHQLQLKLDAITAWCEENGLLLKTQLLTEKALADNNALSEWQKEQFYTQGIVLAGAEPYWWLISHEEATEHQAIVDEFKTQAKFKQYNLVDFGPVNAVDQNALFETTYAVGKCVLIDGHVSLDLLYQPLLLETVTSFPLLSSVLKHAIYQGESRFSALENQALKLSIIESYAEESLINIAREVFYKESQEALSVQLKQAQHPWRREFVKQLTTLWGWSETQLQTLDNRHSSIKQNQLWFTRLAPVIQSLLEKLELYCKNHQLDTRHEMTYLKQLYRLRFQPQGNQIPSLPLSLRPELNESRLYLYRFKDQQDWLVSQVPLADNAKSGLYQHSQLIDVLSWAINHHLLAKTNWLSVTDQHQKYTTSSVIELSHYIINQGLGQLDIPKQRAEITTTETIVQVLVFPNLEQQPSNKLSQQGLQLSSKQNDPLNYSSFKESLVLTLDCLFISSHGQIYSTFYQGQTAVLEMLTSLLLWQPAAPPKVNSWCTTPGFEKSINHRFETLIPQVCQLYQTHSQRGKFLINLADRPYQLQWHDEQVEYVRRPMSQTFWQHLADNTHTFTAQALDSYLDKDQLLNTLLSYQTAEQVSIFLYLEKNTVVYYLIDEYANLVRQQVQHLSESTLMGHLQMFLSHIKADNKLKHIRFYLLSRHQQSWKVNAIAPQNTTQTFLPVQVTMDSPALDAACTIMCGKKWFEGRADDINLFAQVHQLIYSLRQNNQTYPLYINQLQFTDNHTYPTAIYIQQKNRLEQLFNQQ
ncbi:MULTISPECIES: class I adenylate cyclase [Methylophaga]|uniref:Adenylate cyclase n=1 Tax=Methylophaga aminisulfidivorans MP TaxID=1026882 RepID=F5SY72_9GAMM|nr:MULTISPECIES: class I adenylate cyclase [Methylophaga]EGL54117.1 adenylate cyclase [Methylophaga aminisulfidivorans MP]WVI85308.1 class I adenylate cyclase [Methylophaga thalassica]